MKNKKNEVIYSINTRDKFLKFKTTAFEINKVVASFVHFDASKEHGSQIVAQADFYLSFEDAKLLAEDILTGKITQLIKAEMAKGNKYPKPVWSLQGGINANTCAEKQIRTDGKALARVMSIQPGTKFPYVFRIEQGPGKETPEGLIVPEWSKPEISMYIPCDGDTIRKTALMLNSCIDAKITADMIAGKR